MQTKLAVANLRLFSKFGLDLAFEIDTLRIFRLNAVGKEILEQAKGKTPEELETSLKARHPRDHIRKTLSSLINARLIGPDQTLSQGGPGGGFLEKSPPGREKGLNKLVLSVTDRCNLECRYCLTRAESSAADQGDMSARTAARAVDFFLERMNGHTGGNIVFYGGEPLLNPRCIRQTHQHAQRRAKEHNKTLIYTLITNGTLLNDETIDFLVSNRFAIGLSLDGDQPAHDANRVFANGAGSYSRVINNYRKLIQKGADVTPQAVLSSTGANILETVNGLHSQGVINYKLIPRMMPDGDLDVTDIEPGEYGRQYDHMIEKKLNEAGDTPDLLPIDLYTILQQIGRGLKIETSCTGALSQIAVSPQGDIYPCDNFLYRPEFRMGSVSTGITDDLGTTFEKAGYPHIDDCRDCWARNLCGGPCPYFSYKKHGRLDRTVESFCSKTRQTMETALAVYTICKAKNKNFLQEWLKKRSTGVT
jgi:uncharacterized protein